MLNIKNDDIIKISRKKGKKTTKFFFCKIELHTSFFCLKIQNNTNNCKTLKKITSPPSGNSLPAVLTTSTFHCVAFTNFLGVSPRQQTVHCLAHRVFTLQGEALW